MLLQKRSSVKVMAIQSNGGVYNASLKLPEDATVCLGILTSISGIVPPNPTGLSNTGTGTGTGTGGTGTGTGTGGNNPNNTNTSLPYFAGVAGLVSPLTAGFVQSLGANSYPASGPTLISGIAATDQYLYYASPQSKGTATFWQGIGEGGFLLVGTVSVLINNISTVYQVWRTGNEGLGNISPINVIHLV